MVCWCSMAGTKNCLYCNRMREYGYDFFWKPEYNFPQPERIIIEFPKVKTYTTTTTTSTNPYEIR